MADESFTDEFAPIPKEITDGITETATRMWFQQVRARLSRARPSTPGTVQKMPAQPDSTAPSATELRDDFNALLAKLRAAGMMEI